LGALGARSIGSWLREFVVRDPGNIVSGPNKMAEVVEGMRDFFSGYYRQLVVPAVTEELGQDAESIPDERWPVIGLIVGGFSSGSYLSEVWHILIPHHDQPNSAEQVRPQGNFGSHWWAMFEPIRRYTLGYDYGLFVELMTYFEKLRGLPFSEPEQDEINTILARYSYYVPFAAMPMQEGIEYTRWLVELVVNHHRFAEEPPAVGGEVKIGTVTYTGDQFQILEPEVQQ